MQTTQHLFSRHALTKKLALLATYSCLLPGVNCKKKAPTTGCGEQETFLSYKCFDIAPCVMERKMPSGLGTIQINHSITLEVEGNRALTLQAELPISIQRTNNAMMWLRGLRDASSFSLSLAPREGKGQMRGTLSCNNKKSEFISFKLGKCDHYAEVKWTRPWIGAPSNYHIPGR